VKQTTGAIDILAKRKVWKKR